MPHTATIYLDWGAAFEFDVPAAAVHPLLPPGIAPVETAPGLAVLTLNVLHFRPGGDGIELPDTYEIDIGVSVEVDNAGFDGLPQADTAVHVLNIAATSAPYLARCEESGYRVHRVAGLGFDRAEAGRAASVLDADGPIVSFGFDCRDPATVSFTRTGQDVVHDHRGLFRLNFVFAGAMLAASPDCPLRLTAHVHPFFRGLPVQRAAIRNRSLIDPGANVSFYVPDGP